ncbi:uncharacterized protein E0L32_005966 [Thyridium curvatum]|uniref:2EXR domain-containing protein n=1 Tax=Thyridium curvatum TaxID=1093900 RepID=A0A507ARR9_9PEZI|nr:uncharacterized protein E0L32_005966 [Thyridium curvatum]TPX13495.1 hypothetical protein E0L32_005966 [Thyridium curvatum]
MSTTTATITVTTMTLPGPAGTAPPPTPTPSSQTGTGTGTGIGAAAAAAEQHHQLRQDPEQTFTLFPDLPAELRLRIWDFSLQPRVVVLHTRKAHYSDPDKQPGSVALPPWKSSCRNPAALYACSESRSVALERYPVTIPLPGEGNRRPHGLYLDPERDTVVVLGDFDVQRLRKLNDVIEMQQLELEPLRRRYDAYDGPLSERLGMKRAGLSAACFTSEGSGAMLAAFGRTALRKFDEVVLVLHFELTPPSWFTRGSCSLEECTPDNFQYQRFAEGKGRSLRAGSGWMVVGKNPLKLRDLVFKQDGW